MFTWICALGKVTGAEAVLAGVLAGALIYVGVCLLVPANRSARGIRKILLALLAAELACDAAWFLIYFPGFEYRNWGIGGAYGILLWPAALTAAGLAACAVNRSHSRANRKESTK